MTEERDLKPAGESSEAANAARQRKKRKWDQPAESLLSAGVFVTGTLPLCTGGTVGISLPGNIPLHHSVITNPVPANSASSTSLLSQSSSISQNSAVIIQKLAQPKIQDELIAREIVINDAEPIIRYKLTKRQTQEEIQRSTGAVVITRGKFRPSNALPDSEKPLYLHISAGAHLKDTAERIIAVDRAAVMVEDILKHGQNSAMSSGQATQQLSTCLYLGFETDPSLNIADRVRGPNDMYINHIMNETGAIVVLRGKGADILENSSIEEAQQPLHLYLTSTNPKYLEAARTLAENLLDTISAECGASRISSCKVYSAVPPPHQLPSRVQSSVEGLGENINPVARLAAGSALAFTANGSTSINVSPPVSTLHSGFMPNYNGTQPHMVSQSYPPVLGGTCYIGYGGIFPQATPLQQVALALRKAPASITPGQASTACVSTGFASTASVVSMPSKTTSSSIAETKKGPPQRRKFQELPVVSEDTTTHHQNLLQESECIEAGSKESNVRNVSTMPPPKKLVQMEYNGMQPPPPRTMPPPPPRTMPPPSPKFDASKTTTPPPPRAASLGYGSQATKSQDPVMKRTNDEPVPDTLLMLVGYGDDDDNEDDAPGEEYLKSNLGRRTSSKPFWAV